MKSRKFIQAAVLNYVTEMEKINLRTNYLLENQFKVETPSKKLFENLEDSVLAEELAFEGIMDRIKNFFSGKSLSTLTPEEDGVIKNLRQKVEMGSKQVADLSKVSIEDPTKFGMNLEQMVKVAEEIKRAADEFESVMENADETTQEELQKVVPELMKAKMSLFGLVAFKLTEIRKEVTDALQSLVSFIPSGQLSHALDLARKGYRPELPMKGAGEMASGFLDFSGGTTRIPGGVGMGSGE